MNRAALMDTIREKKSVLCVGLDTDPEKIPRHLLSEEDPVFAFNKAIIDATKEYAVAFKLNTAFYEAQGLSGWRALQRTLDYIPPGIFTIADAKRGDIGNTSVQYAKTFFHTFPFDSITVAPYMGEDSVKPFLGFEGKWAIVLGLTSNPGSQDFQLLPIAGAAGNGNALYEKVLMRVSEWGTSDNLMFVIGATRADQLKHVRTLLPEHFFLIPGVGSQGGEVSAVCEHTLIDGGGILVNVSRGVIFAGENRDFAAKAGEAAASYQRQMSVYL